ncbi:hypothetical protein AW15_17900 [Aeromonas sp. HZM]|uniref:head-tail connector protein n=1 Tax=Aeromonas sp. HZM TaxID=1454008 RepID=UPI0004D4C0B5|nr:head-tail connector protein [Aeromonas sp. HZM]KDV01778.1 hypothetical protein AW15_17900 [Aeromonas sp. HZM]
MITLALVKEHLRLSPTDTSEDNILDLYLLASIDAATSHIGEPVVNDSTMKPSIKAGCLLLIGTLYEARADTTELQRHIVPQTVERLWSAHRIHGVY